jgi:hypothetical protein
MDTLATSQKPFDAGSHEMRNDVHGMDVSNGVHRSNCQMLWIAV